MQQTVRHFTRQWQRHAASFVIATALALSSLDLATQTHASTSVGTITLAWDPSPDLTVAGYMLYYGLVGSNTTNSTAVGNATITTVGNLQAGATYFFFVTAYNAQFLESDPSNVITDTPLPSNSSPQLTPIGPQTVGVGDLLSFTAIATDADAPEQSLAFGLDVGAPDGATINPVTGQFSWTPTSDQSGANYSVTIRVTDNGTPALSDAQTFIVAVPAVCAPPLPPSAGSTLSSFGSVTVSWNPSSDINVAGYKVYYGAFGGGTTNTLLVTNVTSVTLTNLAGGVPYFFFVTAFDSALRESDPSTLMLATPLTTETPINTAPKLASIGNMTVQSGALLTFRASATDTDLPAQTLTFTLASGSPSGARIDPVSGEFTWAPTISQADAIYPVTIQVTDSGSPALSDAQSFMITVPAVIVPLLPPSSGSVSSGPHSAALTWNPSPDNRVVGYKVYFGAVNGGTTNTLSVANINSVTLSNLTSGSPYFFLVTAYEITLRESDPTTVLFATPTEPPPVTPANTAPKLASIGNMTAQPGTLLAFRASATDSDLPVQTLTFALASDAPSGATIDPVSGQFSWIPTSSQANTSYPVTVQVTDNGSPALNDAQTFTIAVGGQALPVAPVLAGTNDPASGFVTLTWNPGPNDRSYSVYYGVVNSVVTNEFWGRNFTSLTLTNLPLDVPHFFYLTAYNSDWQETLPSNVLFITPTKTVVTNSPPKKIQHLRNRVVVAGSLLSFPVSVTNTVDSTPTPPLSFDSSAEELTSILTFSLAPGAPTGASIDPVTGVFSWIPTRAQVGTTNRITICVTDNATPPLHDEQTFVIVVNKAAALPLTTLPAPEQLKALLNEANRLTLEWKSDTKILDGFRVERSTDGVNFKAIATVDANARTCQIPEPDAPYAFAYPYSFRICAFRGSQVSSYSSVAAALTNHADLIVTGVRTTPAFPAAGQSVLFKVTVKNIGQVATLEGPNARVAIYVDGGDSVAWANNTTALWPGQSMNLDINAGPSSTGAWLATAGEHTLTAIVDDANQVPEENEANNQFNKPLVIASAETPLVSVALDQSRLTETSTNISVLTFTRSGDTTADLTLQFNITGTARDGRDYAHLPNSVVIPAGAPSVTVVVTALNDQVEESRESLGVSLLPTLNYRLAPTSSVTLWIEDNAAN